MPKVTSSAELIDTIGTFYFIMHLIMVYNADSGYVNATMDTLHKLVSPSTYDCSLCKLTHGAFTEKEQWKAFVKETDHTLTFLHRDEAEKQRISERFDGALEYPCILQHKSGSLTYLLSPEELGELENPDELISAIRERTAEQIRH